MLVSQHFKMPEHTKWLHTYLQYTPIHIRYYSTWRTSDALKQKEIMTKSAAIFLKAKFLS